MPKSKMAPTPGQRKVLLNLHRNLPPASGFTGRSQMGGLETILSSLIRRGWIDGKWRITEEGQTVVNRIVETTA